LQQQFAAAQTNIQTLSEQLQSISSETLMSKEKLAAMQAEARKQAEQASALQQQLSQLSQSNQMVIAEKQRLATQLEVAQVEQRHATEQVVRMTQEVKTEREEKAKLAEGVKQLASKSGELATEIRENRPLTANQIFTEFLTNRVEARFNAIRPGLFDEASRNRETKTLLVSDGTNTFALCHVQDTPLGFSATGTEWESLAGTLGRGSARFPIRSLSFCWPDPRVVLMPVTTAEATRLGCRVYHVSSTPYKFQDTVVVGAEEGYYGECKFEIDTSTPDYVKLDRSVLKGLFGKFNPSRGDLVFSKTGELLGVMANDTYCLLVRAFDATATLRFGGDVRAQHTAIVLSGLYAQVAQLPAKLQ
jgi:X-X-X-Leu-X-X-Gly heptad repeat protein